MAEPKHIAPVLQNEHEADADAKRVVMVSKLGRSVAYEDTSFVSADSPAVLDVNTDLGNNGGGGYIINDGKGSIKIEISDDGTNYGGQHTLKNGEKLSFNGLSIDRIRLTWVSDSSYRVLVSNFGADLETDMDSPFVGYQFMGNQTVGSYEYFGFKKYAGTDWYIMRRDTNDDSAWAYAYSSGTGNDWSTAWGSPDSESYDDPPDA